VIILVIAQAWGQVKLILTLWLGSTSLPPAIQWAVGSALAIAITLACYHSTNWMIDRWEGKR
jgi:hypothetical protein